jgi:putative flippase GtrA
MSRQFVSFVIAGGIAAAVNIGSRVIFSRFMAYEIAVVVAYLCGMIAAFMLNRLFVFENAQGGNPTRQAVRFTLVNLVALVQVLIVGVGLVRLVFPAVNFTWHAETVAHVIAVASPIVTSYLAHKHFSFTPDAARTEPPAPNEL